jgi:UDP-N-acetylmuramate dehydrogenase
MSQIGNKVRGRLLMNESLAPYTSWRTGGAADYLYLPADCADLADFLQHVPSDLPVTWLGLGSNTLVRDQGVSGIVILTQGMLNQLSVLDNIIRAEAGVASAQLARFAARLGLTGLEFLAGVPGTVGGALAMNAGCFGGETWTYVAQVETMNRQGVVQVRPRAHFDVAYRHVKRPSDEWFIAGCFQLERGDKDSSLAKIRTLLERRNATQPTGIANSGSVFRNPPGDYAGRLIEACGLKGLKRGGALVSEKHANFILNEGAATAGDIESLIIDVADIVKEKTGISLMPEVCIMGRE